MVLWPVLAYVTNTKASSLSFICKGKIAYNCSLPHAFLFKKISEPAPHFIGYKCYFCKANSSGAQKKKTPLFSMKWPPQKFKSKPAGPGGRTTNLASSHICTVPPSFVCVPIIFFSLIRWNYYALEAYSARKWSTGHEF